MNRFPTYIVHPSRPLQLEPTDEHGDAEQILVCLDDPVWSVKAIMQLGRSGISIRHVALRRYFIRCGGPGRRELCVYAVDAESALKACEANE